MFPCFLLPLFPERRRAKTLLNSWLRHRLLAQTPKARLLIRRSMHISRSSPKKRHSFPRTHACRTSLKAARHALWPKTVPFGAGVSSRRPMRVCAGFASAVMRPCGSLLLRVVPRTLLWDFSASWIPRSLEAREAPHPPGKAAWRGWRGLLPVGEAEQCRQHLRLRAAFRRATAR